MVLAEFAHGWTNLNHYYIFSQTFVRIYCAEKVPTQKRT